MTPAALLALALAAPQSLSASESPALSAPPELARVAVVGASVSAGFGSRAGRRRIDLADALAAALGPLEPRVHSGGSHWMFLDAERSGTRMAERAADEDPTLVVALDFLFWFGYGRVADEADRLARLELGLELLDVLPGTLVVGDLPDVSPALRAPVPMISASQVPPPESLRRLNERVVAWAAERERVVLVPVAEFARRVHEGEPVSVRGNRWEAPAGPRLLQPDLLHASGEGTVGLALLVLDALVEARPALAAVEDAIEWDVAAVLARLARGEVAGGPPDASRGPAERPGQR